MVKDESWPGLAGRGGGVIELTHTEKQLALELAIQVAKSLIADFQAELQLNALSAEDARKAAIICHDMRNEPEMAEAIGKFRLLADQTTNGVFSATLDAEADKRRH